MSKTSQLQAQLDAAKAANAEMQRVQSQALRLVANSGPFFSDLTQLTGVDAVQGTIQGSLTTDHQGIVVDLGAATFVLDPWGQAITVNDASSKKVPSITVSCHNGVITDGDQTTILGHVQRILRASETGSDPVVAGANLVGTPVATA